MKCKHCGSNLDLEMRFCPYCGRKNREAQKHAADMEYYKTDYENTKKDVYEATKNYTRVTVQVVIIAILLIAIMVCMGIQKNSFEISYNYRDWRAERKQEKYCKIIDDYMEEEDYLALGNFCRAKHISYTYGTGYEEYEPVIRSASYYVDVYNYMMDIVEEDDLGVGIGDSNLDTFCTYLDYFYRTLDMEEYEGYENYDRQENIDCLEKMEKEVSYMLITYFGLSEEEAAGFKDKTDAKRYVFLEEKIGAK